MVIIAWSYVPPMWFGSKTSKLFFKIPNHSSYRLETVIISCYKVLIMGNMLRLIHDLTKFSRRRCKFWIFFLFSFFLWMWFDLGDRCKTVYCFHCGTERTRLSCECKEFEEEIDKYNTATVCKLMFLTFAFAIGLYIWATRFSDDLSDTYFWNRDVLQRLRTISRGIWIQLRWFLGDFC